MPVVYGDPLILTEDDDSKLFIVRVVRTGEERIARYHHRTLAGLKLKFPCFADPDHPDDYRSWLHEGWGGQAVRRIGDNPRSWLAYVNATVRFRYPDGSSWFWFCIVSVTDPTPFPEHGCYRQTRLAGAFFTTNLLSERPPGLRGHLLQNVGQELTPPPGAVPPDGGPAHIDHLVGPWFRTVRHRTPEVGKFSDGA